MSTSTTNAAAREVVAEMRGLAPTCENDWRDMLNEWADRFEATLTQQQGGEQEARYFASGPEGHFYADDLAFAEAIIRKSLHADDWTITDIAALRTKQPAASEGVDPEICMRLVQLVEGGGLTWRDSSGNHRLKDTPDWVAFYCATNNAREREASAKISKQDWESANETR